MGFAKEWGFGRFDMLNASPFVATDPRKMRAAADPIGPENDEWLPGITGEVEFVVAAWGSDGAYLGRGPARAGPPAWHPAAPPRPDRETPSAAPAAPFPATCDRRSGEEALDTPSARRSVCLSHSTDLACRDWVGGASAAARTAGLKWAGRSQSVGRRSVGLVPVQLGRSLTRRCVGALTSSRRGQCLAATGEERVLRVLESLPRVAPEGIASGTPRGLRQ